MDMVAGTLLRAWLVQKQKPMLVDFLNSLASENKVGVVEDLPDTMDDEKLKSAVDLLLTKYPPEPVAGYLNAFNDKNEANGPNLTAMLETDARLQRGGAA
jgi:hypothetical protein